MAVSVAEGQVWESVLEQTKSAQEKNSDPLLWAVQLSSRLNSAGVSLPSIDLAHLLVSHICWDNNLPITWKFLEKALTANLAPSMLVLALLSIRTLITETWLKGMVLVFALVTVDDMVIPNRKFHPTAYRLYMELLRRHAFSLKCQINGPNYQTIMKSIDDVLHLSLIFGIQVSEPGLLLVEFVFLIVLQLLDASLEDEGLLEHIPEKKSIWPTVTEDMDIYIADNCNKMRNEQHDVLYKGNTMIAIEIIGEFLQNKVTSRILFLAWRNMPSHWEAFIQKLRVLAANGSLTSSSGQYHGTSPSALWLPIDLFLEDAMDGSKVAATGATETLTGLVKALQAVNGTTWHDTFLGLWIAALRLVQRERDISEGPIPRLDTCLCMLFSITTLVVANIVEEEESELMDESDCSRMNQTKEKQITGRCRKDLISSLQMLINYEALLTPPQSICSVANQTAAKAIMFVSGLTVGNGYYECMSVNDMPMNCSGNLRHLIVEACIARNLLDTSAYLWPGYVNARANIPHSVPSQVPGWSSLMKGSPLTPALINALIATPASSLPEIEKIYEIATKGSNDEKISAASILCGASLVRGWNIQEQAVMFITSLLSPQVPANYSGSESHLISYAPFLNVLLVGISSVDCVQIFSLHGMVPLLAGALMPLCEVFGSTAPNVSWTLPTGEELTTHAVFSNAFTLLLRLWKFDHPPVEHVMRDATPVGSQPSPEYLLLVRNSKISAFGKSPKDRLKIKRISKNLNFPTELIFMDSFPKLKCWYRQHQECIASTLSGLVQGTTVHQTVDALLNMMFRKIGRGSQSLTSTTSGSSSSSATGAEDILIRLKLPAWDILEGTPYVLDAALTACAHGRIAPRELATGLKDLADFLPATLGTIVSYFSAEVTRGIWKPVFMNGTDWPSPLANLSIVEQQIKKIIAATGVDFPSLATEGSSPAMLPLPLAALVSLAITYKLDKTSERFLCLIGPALNSLGGGCPWPCMPIISALWAQKVKRWNDFLVFSASCTVFHHNSDAVVQLLRSCFTSTLGLSPSIICSNGGVGAVLGHGFGSHFAGGMAPVAPDCQEWIVKEENGETEEDEVRTEIWASFSWKGNDTSQTCCCTWGFIDLALRWIRLSPIIDQRNITFLVHINPYSRPLGTWRCSFHAMRLCTCLLRCSLWYLCMGRGLGLICIQTETKGFLSLLVGCTHKWVLDINVDVLKRLSNGLRQWNEKELAIALLGLGGADAAGTAAELIIKTGA
ncbi:Mediator of RNA polymerase II transcription subunit 33A [Hibiscus syriacus]|uniref:Mediator of RNA polymerase II transcription subunit 33A n=1 Tax=Hibiscus syriacus TaxID=106335 RepID=A0A6A2XAD6_HIBSY|nr:Mediator of RNA polymerase II transcription subunit 33A [Hibiscus syriacus]